MHQSIVIPSFIHRHRQNLRAFGSAGPFVRAPQVAALALLVVSSFSIKVTAQDCKLSVQATPNVLVSGQTANVSVFAHMPAGSYAFAASLFDVFSTHPSWSYASAGGIVGANVLGINVGQNHAPQVGVLADPANPIRVWRGNFSPVSAAPALVQIVADPTTFWYYPSALTSSAAACDAKHGDEWVFVNPLYLGKYGAAPGAGTELKKERGSFVATTEEEAILIGLLLPAVQKAGPHVKVFNGFEIAPDVPPTHLTLSAGLPVLFGEGKKVKIDFVKTDKGDYEVSGEFPLGSEIHFYRKGVVVHDISVSKFNDGSSTPLFVVDQIPDRIASSVEPVSVQRSMVRSLTVTFDGTVSQGGVSVAVADLDGDGDVRFIADGVVVYTGLEDRINLQKAGPGTLILSAGSVGTLALAPVVR